MSVALGSELKNPSKALEGRPVGFKLVGWTAGFVRSLKLGVCRDPDPQTPAHGLVFTTETDENGVPKNEIPKRARSRLAEAAEWVIGLTDGEVEAARRRTAGS